MKFGLGFESIQDGRKAISLATNNKQIHKYTTVDHQSQLNAQVLFELLILQDTGGGGGECHPLHSLTSSIFQFFFKPGVPGMKKARGVEF